MFVKSVTHGDSGQWTRRIKRCDACGCKRITVEKLVSPDPDEVLPKPVVKRSVRRRGLVVA
jgi:hypothetical protein